jgi:hypothetical protein
MNKKTVKIARCLTLCGGLALLATGCAKQFNVNDNAFPAPAITNVVYPQSLVIEGNNFDSLLSVVNVDGQQIAGFTYRNNSGVQILQNNQYRPAGDGNNPLPVTVTVKGEVSNVFPILFYPQINSFSPDTAVQNKPLTVNGILFGKRTVPSSLTAFYIDGNQRKTAMSPDPTINSWNPTSIRITVPNYDAYTFGRTLINFYIQVSVGSDTTNQELLYLK